MEKYKSIIWDFDGVILDSSKIRSQGFIETLQDFPDEQVSQLLAYHNANGGLSRYHKLRYFFEVVRGEEVSEEKLFEYARAFKAIMLNHLCKPELLIRDSLNFIVSIHQKVVCHIASGSDGEELNEICSQLKIAHHFKSINGSPIPKIQIVKEIMEANPFEPSEYALIGDSINDYEAAQINNIDFYAYNNTELTQGIRYVKSFSPLNFIPFS